MNVNKYTIDTKASLTSILIIILKKKLFLKANKSKKPAWRCFFNNKNKLTKTQTTPNQPPTFISVFEKPFGSVTI